MNAGDGMKKTHRRFINRIKKAQEGHTNCQKITDCCLDEPDIQEELDLQKELEKRFRELSGEAELRIIKKGKEFAC